MSRTETCLENGYMTKESMNIYIALELLDFTWDEKDVLYFDSMWKEGISLERIAEFFNRPEDEIGILIMDRCRKGFIKPRESGVEGIER